MTNTNNNGATGLFFPDALCLTGTVEPHAPTQEIVCRTTGNRAASDICWICGEFNGETQEIDPAVDSSPMACTDCRETIRSEQNEFVVREMPSEISDWGGSE